MAKQAEKRRRRPRGVMPNKIKIRRLRQERGWDQEEMAEKLGYDKRTIERAEQKGKRISLYTISDIAETLGVEIHDLIVPDIDGGDDPKEWLDRAIRADLASNYGYAIEVAKAIIEDVDVKTAIFGEACVRLAPFYDHRGDWETAIEVLQKNMLSDRVCPNDSVKGQLRWALYQRGILHRRYAEELLIHTGGKKTQQIKNLLAEAQSDFENVLRSGQKGQKAAPLHQLGVLLMINQRYEAAMRKFNESLKLREANARDPTDPEVIYRLAYTHRRIGQCLAHQRQFKKAKQEFHTAMEMATQSKHRRLELEIQRELDAWSLTK